MHALDDTVLSNLLTDLTGVSQCFLLTKTLTSLGKPHPECDWCNQCHVI